MADINIKKHLPGIDQAITLPVYHVIHWLVNTQMYTQGGHFIPSPLLAEFRSLCGKRNKLTMRLSNDMSANNAILGAFSDLLLFFSFAWLNTESPIDLMQAQIFSWVNSII